MALPTDLQFTQQSLQDFADCQRRFQLRHLQQVAWPAVLAEPADEYEHHLEQGAQFHRLIQQHLLGIPKERLSAMASKDEDLARWWGNYLAAGPAVPEGARHTEIVLSAPLATYRLLAKYDLIVVDEEGFWHIFDWKTARRPPGRERLAQRLQTRVYPYLLVEAGAHLNGNRAISPDHVEMNYWFAELPKELQRLSYNQELHRENQRYLTTLVREMELLDRQTASEEGSWPLTPHEERCLFCLYRSLCDRGKRAGTLDEIDLEAEWEADLDLDLDFEQIAEIAY